MRAGNLRNSSETIGVFIVDQNRFFRQGLGMALSQYRGIKVLGGTAVEDGVYEAIASTSPQVIIIGMTDDFNSEIQLIRRITQEFPEVSLIALGTGFGDNELIQVLAAGVSAHSNKDIGAVALAHMIRRVAGGEFLITEKLISEPPTLTKVLKHFQDLLARGRATELADSPITAREAEVLTHAACGYGNKQIASILSVSEQTVKNHMASILRKMAASDRTHAVVKAMQCGWIVPSIGNQQESWPLSAERDFC